jgi:hypothetical protein
MMWQVVGEQDDLSECITLLLYYIIPLNPCLLTGESINMFWQESSSDASILDHDLAKG